MVDHGIVAWAASGLLAGIIAKFIAGGWDAAGCLASVAAAVAGALVAGYLWQAYAHFNYDGPVELFVALAGATMTLWVLRTLSPRH
ncbi:MAG: hypothetical protein JO290_10015 [Sphingomonadaceae bacterium]|nr:hypothetical protein [Sphingomonadaceae bacterium]